MLNAVILGTIFIGYFISSLKLSVFIPDSSTKPLNRTPWHIVAKFIAFIRIFLIMMLMLMILYIPSSILIILYLSNYSIQKICVFFAIVLIVSGIMSAIINCAVLTVICLSWAIWLIQKLLENPKINFIFLNKRFSTVSFFKKDNVNSNNYKKNSPFWFKLIFPIIFAYMIILCSIYWIGYQEAESQKKFKFLDNNFIVIYETSDTLYLSKYEVSDFDNFSILINPHIQKSIPKDDKVLWIKSCKEVVIGN